MALGAHPKTLAALDGALHLDGQIGIPWMWVVQTVTGDTTYNLYDTAYGLSGPRLAFKVLNAHGIVTGGAGAGTAVVQRVSSTGTATAITDTANLAGLGLVDTDLFDFTQINDATMEVSVGQNLRVTTTGNALCIVYVECCWSA
jgi:hypothetical protein